MGSRFLESGISYLEQTVQSNIDTSDSKRASINLCPVLKHLLTSFWFHKNPDPENMDKVNWFKMSSVFRNHHQCFFLVVSCCF